MTIKCDTWEADKQLVRDKVEACFREVEEKGACAYKLRIVIELTSDAAPDFTHTVSQYLIQKEKTDE